MINQMKTTHVLPDIDKILNEAMMYLMETASKDGIITEEEENLIKGIKISLEFFKSALEHALEDGIITEREEKSLVRIKDLIIEDGFSIANEDELISKDEMNMIVAVILSLKVPHAKDYKGDS